MEVTDFFVGEARAGIGKELGYSPEVEAAISLALKNDDVSQDMLELLGLAERRYMVYLKRLLTED